MKSTFCTRIVTICSTKYTSVERLDESVVVEALEEPGGGQGADVPHAVLDQGLRLGSLLWKEQSEGESELQNTSHSTYEFTLMLLLCIWRHTEWGERRYAQKRT